MSNHDDTRTAPSLPGWLFSAAGVVGSIVIIMVVLGIAYWSSQPTQTIDQEIVAERARNLAEVRAKQTDLYNNFSWVDQKKQIVRIPVKDAMSLLAAKLDAATKSLPEAPARLTLAASPAGFTPPAPSAPALATVIPMTPAAPAAAPAATSAK